MSSAPLHIQHDLVVPGSELSWTAATASGPGGQNVNKVATKVELRFDLPNSAVLSAEVKARMRNLARHRLDAEGKVVVTSQATRNQARNVEDARRKLAELIARALVIPKRRRPTRPSRSSKERRLASKHKHSEKKRTRAAVD
jgi:ribosome-associated protein